MELNIQKFNRTVAAAKAKAPQSYHSHIDAAAQMLMENPFIDEVPGGLEILSETSGKRYFAGISCQCEAWKRGKPCRHRTAARLVRRYKEDV